MKQMWIECRDCGGKVRNSRTSQAKHAAKCGEAQKVAVAAIVERNALREEVAQLRAQLAAAS